MSFIEELKRRNVFRVGIAYAVSSWLVLQVADLVLEHIEAPGWVMEVLFLVAALFIYERMDSGDEASEGRGRPAVAP